MAPSHLTTQPIDIFGLKHDALRRPCLLTIVDMLSFHYLSKDRYLFFLKEIALLRINRSVYIMNNELLDTSRHSLSPNSAMTKTFCHLRKLMGNTILLSPYVQELDNGQLTSFC